MVEQSVSVIKDIEFLISSPNSLNLYSVLVRSDCASPAKMVGILVARFLLICDLITEHTFSIGFSIGEYGAKRNI